MPLMQPGIVDAIPTMVLNPPSLLDPILQTAFEAFKRGDVWLEFFGFDFEWNPLIAHASGQQAEESMDPGIDFLLTDINLVSFSAPGTIVANPDYVMEIQEKSGRTNYSNTTLHVMNFTGNPRGSSFKLPATRYIRGNNTVVAKLTNRTATAAVVNMEFLGWRMSYHGVNRTDLFNVPY